jgi:hypothetical protein
MLVELRSLFGLLCTDEAMPGATDRDCSSALLDAEVLRAATEKVPSLDLANDTKPEQKPSYAPEPSPGMGPGMRR